MHPVSLRVNSAPQDPLSPNGAERVEAGVALAVFDIFDSAFKPALLKVTTVLFVCFMFFCEFSQSSTLHLKA